MRKIMVLALCGLFCGWSAKQARAAEDVYVDLSVLNEIGGSGAASAYARPEPLFPIIKNTPQFPVVEKSAPKPAPKAKAPARKSKPKQKVKPILAVEKEQKIVIPAKPADIQSIQKKESVQPIAEKHSAATKPQMNQQPAKNEPKPAIAAPSAVVELTSEPAPREPVANVPLNNKAPFQAEEPAPAEKTFSAPAEPVKVEEAAPVKKTFSAPAEPVKAEPVVAAEKTGREIVFAADSSELDEAGKAKIDTIIASFENPMANKIIILAYNYDNGQDIFRKKRQSLNRAIEIRSYLLNKGYKNFSIKVINITDDAARGNVVEIDEMK